MSERDSEVSPKKGWSMRFANSKLKVDQQELERTADALRDLFAEDRAEALKELESRRVSAQEKPS